MIYNVTHRHSKHVVEYIGMPALVQVVVSRVSNEEVVAGSAISFIVLNTFVCSLNKY